LSNVGRESPKERQKILFLHRIGKLWERDDNKHILTTVCERLEMGVATYGHGFRKDDDTRQFGTKKDTWVEMGLEEALDLSLYLTAELLRMKDERARE